MISLYFRIITTGLTITLATFNIRALISYWKQFYVTLKLKF